MLGQNLPSSSSILFWILKAPKPMLRDMLEAENADAVCQVCDTNLVEALLSYISWVVAAVAARPIFLRRGE